MLFKGVDGFVYVGLWFVELMCCGRKFIGFDYGDEGCYFLEFVYGYLLKEVGYEVGFILK